MLEQLSSKIFRYLQMFTQGEHQDDIQIASTIEGKVIKKERKNC